MSRRLAWLALVLTFLLATSPEAFADAGGTLSGDGVDVRVAQIDRIRKGLDPMSGKMTTESYEYRTEVACSKQGNDANGDLLLCANVAGQCDPSDPNIGPGPLTR